MKEIPNLGKNLVIEVNGKKFARIPIKTHVITPEDNLDEVIKKYLKNFLEKDDIVFVAEKIIAILQNRAYPLVEIKKTKPAIFLSKFVSKKPGGIGLAMPETMQVAIEEVGFFRIFLALVGAAITKPLGIKGLFYIIAGDGARAVDGPTPNTIPPYNQYVVKGPEKPKKVAEHIASIIGRPVVIVDANDRGIRILGTSKSFTMSKKIFQRILKDNPLGQSSESTPIGILRILNNN
ncbi:MAG: coenzyme F420-0:L-glutamate ligase [Patescibacteria group bacterium]|nr:coenzyme F420-0:L-glutamate ligase [Patescibacteria group bacterium]